MYQFGAHQLGPYQLGHEYQLIPIWYEDSRLGESNYTKN